MIYKVLFLALVVGCISAATTNNDDGKLFLSNKANDLEKEIIMASNY